MSNHRLTPGQVLTTRFPSVGEKEPAPALPGEWSLRVDGLVARPLTLSIPELFRLPLSEKTWDTICVTGWTHPAHRWRGVMLSEVLAATQPRSAARFVRFVAHSTRVPALHDTSLPLDYAAAHVMLASEVEGEPLT